MRFRCGSSLWLGLPVSMCVISASMTYPAQASSVRKGGFILINGYACKVVNMSTAKTGKHGGAKVCVLSALELCAFRRCDLLG
jgi:hypothetical protein